MSRGNKTVEVLPIIIGGVLAIAGGCFTQFVIAKLSRDAERRKFQREKLERLASLAISVDDYLIELQHDLSSNSGRYKSGPINELSMLCALYFPSVKSQAQEFCLLVEKLRESLVREIMGWNNPESSSQEAQVTAHFDHLRKYSATRLQMAEKREELMSALHQLALKIEEEDWTKRLWPPDSR